MRLFGQLAAADARRGEGIVPARIRTVVPVKVCGVCRPDDAALAAGAGAEYVGVVLVPGRSRSQSVRLARQIFAAAGGCRRVGVFVDASPAELIDAGAALGLDALQLHGTEPPEVVGGVRHAGSWEVWKAVRPRGRAELMEGVQRYGAVADALLLDGWSERDVGGTGTAFRWNEMGTARGILPAGVRLVVAGGLRPDNVAAAIARLAPDVVDVSSGVERRIGEKDPTLVRAFIAAARGDSAQDRGEGTASPVRSRLP